MLGPEINSSCILFGAIIGSYIGRLLGETFRKNLMLVFGCINIGMGVFMISKTQALPPRRMLPAARNAHRRDVSSGIPHHVRRP